MKSSIAKRLSAAAILGLMSGIGHIGGQSKIVEHQGHGRVFKSVNVSRETHGKSAGSVTLNKISRKVGEYGGEAGKAKKLAAEEKRRLRRLRRLWWAGGMSFSGTLVRFDGGFICKSVRDRLLELSISGVVAQKVID